MHLRLRELASPLHSTAYPSIEISEDTLDTSIHCFSNYLIDTLNGILIDTLNGIFSTFLDNIAEQLEEVKLNIALQVEVVQKSAADALALAQENQRNFEMFKEETNKKIDYVVAENKCLKFDNDRLEAKVKQNV